jgi:hypothetical protein
MVYDDAAKAFYDAEMDCNAGEFTFCRDIRDCDGEKMCFDTSVMEPLTGRNQCSFEGYGCMCVTKDQVDFHNSGKRPDRKCFNNPHLRQIEDWHTKEREMCEMDDRVYCQSNEQCQGESVCYEEYTNIFMGREEWCNNYPGTGGCYCREKPKNNFCEFSADVQKFMR